jgi:hypothetical protein
MKKIEHMFFSCPLAQHVWCYAANIIWQLFAKRGNLGPQKSFSMMHECSPMDYLALVE